MKRKDLLNQIIKEKPQAVLVKNKYKVLAGMAQRMFPELQEIRQDKLADIVFEIVNADRDWRLLTEDYDRDNKKILEQKYIINNLL